jgi:two-component system sensor histidine kinase VicK
MNSIKVKLMLICAAVVLIVMIISGTVMLWNTREMEIARTEDQLRSMADIINDDVVQQFDRDSFHLANATWSVLGQEDEYRVQGMIISEAGIVIAPVALRGLRFNNQAVLAAIAGQEHVAVGRPGSDIVGTGRQEWINFAMPVTRDGETFIIHTRTTTQFLNESLANTALILVVMVLVSIVLTLVLWFFLANMITVPIVNLTRHTKAIASGDFSSKISAKSNDEIGQLTHNFNDMAQGLHDSLMSITSEKNKSIAILQNTSHGVLAYDAAGNLTHANNASTELLSGLDLQHYNLQAILEFLGFEPQDIYNLQPEEMREVIYQDKEHFIQAFVTSYASQSAKIDGYIIVLQDVSNQMKLDNMRKEFVANVSHELRTPLTSILTYAETLMDGAMEDPETAKSFLKVIDEEAQRMKYLVSDLLELSRIDSNQAALEVDVVDLVALLRLAVRQCQVLANHKQQTIALDTLTVPCFIEANASRINQVISNILSNAVKYSPENTTIHVTMETTEKYYRIFIKDQGMGIPPESMPRIFERFYRVDKARARAMGGTGLGLAIVKEIMEEHGGTVHATSQLGEGTTMVLRFNKYSE